jgi:hypothetical protein
VKNRDDTGLHVGRADIAAAPGAPVVVPALLGRKMAQPLPARARTDEIPHVSRRLSDAVVAGLPHSGLARAPPRPGGSRGHVPRLILRRFGRDHAVGQSAVFPRNSPQWRGRGCPWEIGSEGKACAQ